MIDCIVGFYEECECLTLMLISLYQEIKKYGGTLWIISDNTSSKQGRVFLETIKNSLAHVKVYSIILEGDVKIGRDCLVFEWGVKNLPLANPYILFCHSDIELNNSNELENALNICQRNEDILGAVIFDDGGWIEDHDVVKTPLLFSPRIAPWFALFKRESWFLNRLSWASNDGSIFIDKIKGIEDTGAGLLSRFLSNSPPGRLFCFQSNIVSHWRGMSANLKRIDLAIIPDSMLGNRTVESYKKDFLKKLSTIRSRLNNLDSTKVMHELREVIKVVTNVH
jgi:hypothetical protein